MGKRERDRLRSLDTVALSTERRPRKDRDEIAADRGVVLLTERGGASVVCVVFKPPLIILSQNRQVVACLCIWPL